MSSSWSKRTTSIILYAYYLLSSVQLVKPQDAFNFEIGARVIDKISAFTYIIVKAMDIPVKLAASGSFLLSNSSHTAPAILYPVRNGFQDYIGSVALCEANGHFYAYPANTTLARGFGFIETSPPGYRSASNYLVNDDGSRGEFKHYSSFECATRLWYKKAKSLGYSTWITPNFSPITGQLALYLQYPIFNTTYIDTTGNVKIAKGPKKFIAGIAVISYISNLATFLNNAYKNSDRKVFLVDKPTGILLASSFDTTLVAKSATGQNVRLLE